MVWLFVEMFGFGVFMIVMSDFFIVSFDWWFGLDVLFGLFIGVGFCDD